MKDCIQNNLEEYETNNWDQENIYHIYCNVFELSLLQNLKLK